MLIGLLDVGYLDIAEATTIADLLVLHVSLNLSLFGACWKLGIVYTRSSNRIYKVISDGSLIAGLEGILLAICK